MAVALLGAGITVHAQTSAKDSMRVVNLQEVQVVSTRATAKTPVAFTNIGKAELKKVNFGQDIPYLLSMTPSTLTTSDAGAGIGYTTLRVRGTDGTRINITVNGIPMNDAESHNLFWVNMPDFSSSVKDMQVQRGAGTSTNGAGAFGASVNMQTEGASMKPYAEFNGSYGSFNTHKETVKVGTGLLNNHWTFDARLSNIGTDGYIDRASVDLNSYYLQGGYFAENTSVKLIAFAGKEKTYHAWGYATKEEMEKFGRRYNPCGEMYTDADGNKHYYTDQTDNYLQKNYQLLLNHSFSTAWNLNVALHYTKGDGYYEEYKPGSSLVEYGLKPFNPDGTETNESDLVRQKKMDNKFGGGVFSLNYTGNRLTASLGGGLNQYRGNNFGKVTWVKNYIGILSPEHEYYRNKSKKTDGNIYLKANYDLTSTLSAYADLQYRHIDYTIDGVNDKYDWNKNALRPLAVDKKFDFFNPKVGLNWNITPNHRLYASFSVAQKEPTRNNYTDGDPDSYPKAEKLLDYEVGYTFRKGWFNAGVNLYYMDYKNQLVLNGLLNEIGEAVAENVKNSYRMGIELMAGARITNWLRWDINATWSRNRIKNYTEYLSDVNEDWKDMYSENWGISQTTRYIGTTPISFSPDFMANSLISLDYKGFNASLQTQYVSKQYLNNAHQEDCTLDAYCVSNLNLGYTFKLKGLKSVNVGVTIYNLFDETYESNGYASGSAVYEGHGKNQIKDKDSKLLYTSNYAAYYPNAGINALAHITLSF